MHAQAVTRAASAEEVRTTIATVLTPYLGRSLGESSSRMYVERLGARADACGPAELDQLSQWIAPGLKVFVGPQRAAQVLDELNGALARLLERP